MQRRLEMLDQLIANRQLQQAIVLGEQLRKEQPASVHACLSLSEAYRQLGLFTAARACAEIAYQLESGDGFVCAQYARTLVPFADHNAIQALLLKHLQQDHRAIWVDEMMGVAAVSIDEWQLALSCFERVLASQPGHLHARYMRGVALSVLGASDDAILAFKKLIREHPGYGRAWWSLADIDLAVVDEKQLVQLLGNKQLHDSDRVYFWQVLGQLQQRSGNHKAAFESWENANQIKRRNQASQSTCWDELAATLLHQAENCSGATTSVSAESPIFIVGLPRSGSTLVEQLITNSGQVTALGELRDLEVLVQQAIGLDPVPLPFKLDRESSRGIVHAEIANAYIQRVRSRCADGRYSDKNPVNFLFVGIIQQAFPNARIIHVYKHPMDACLGVFKHQFAAAAPWSYSVSDIAHFYTLYQNVMSAWERLYPGRVCHVSYEDLLQNPDKVTQGVFAYCDLAWSDKVMDLTLRKGPVLSASANQVREGVHTRALFAHRNFEAQL
ncbi:MAG: sulfotransferase, partial [Pseudohongiella sp.]|nr:sulfotransferase [Pseudohongiella sp.]